MRTTLTLDDDVAAKLEEEVRRTRRSFRETVNAVLRLGLNAGSRPPARKPFRVRARPLGQRPGLDFDNIGELLERLEGPAPR